MGYGRWDSNDWDSYSKKTSRQTTREIFNASSIKKSLDPKNIKTRESRDSLDNPHSTPIILALDVTGSMGEIAGHLARKGLGKLVEDILDQKPVSDPHIMVMGVGDAECDKAPLQASQFESDIRIAEQLKDIYLEGGGGGNGRESYNLPWYFAAKKTDVDCVKHNRKGLLFTFGDEECPHVLRAEHIKEFVGDKATKDILSKDLYAEASQKFDIFHVVIEQGDYALHSKDSVYKSWEKVLPKENIISVKDYTKISEILVSVMEVYNGKDPNVVLSRFKGDTARVVKEAIKNVKAKYHPATQPVKRIQFKGGANTAL